MLWAIGRKAYFAVLTVMFGFSSLSHYCFGLFANSSEIMRIILIIISILICIGIFFWAIKQNNILLLFLSSAIIGGALGNVVDRIIYGAVADFLNVTCCGIYNPYSFNIADISIFFGVAGIIFFPNVKN